MFKSANMEYSDFKRAASLGNKHTNMMSKRFNENCNLDEMTSFSFVNATSTLGEKML